MITPETDTASCARCKRTVRIGLMRVETVAGKRRNVCGRTLKTSCDELALRLEEKRSIDAENAKTAAAYESNTAESVPK